MSGDGAPVLAIPLRDGTELHIGPDGVRVQGQTYELDRLQDARQVSPDPETIALRVAGAGLVEFQPARPGDGAVVLAVLFRLRPDLRPAGFEAMPPAQPMQRLPPGAPPPPPYFPYGPYGPPVDGTPIPYGTPMFGYPPPPNYPPNYPPPPGFPPLPPNLPPGMIPPHGPQDGRLTPFPRSFGDVLGAIFQLYGRHFVKWLVLGLCVAFIPAFLLGGVEIAFYQMIGIDPWTMNFFSSFNVSSSSTPEAPFSQVPSTSDVLILAAISLGLLVLWLFFSAWQTASLAIGGREALMGRQVSIGASLGGGLRRLLPTLGTILLVGLILFAVELFVAGLGVLAFVGLGVAGAANTSGTPDSSQAAGAFLLVFLLLMVFYVLFGIVATYITTKLGLAPYAAATEKIGPGRAVAKSWRLTRGNWWRTFGIIFLIGLIVGVVSYVSVFAEMFSLAIAVLIAQPLVVALAAPLTALAYTAVLYDLRVRHEGYFAIMQKDAEQTKPLPPLG